ncbi:hypothetical protein D9758_008062 [Tetrapyrgos nigripes]|uniref:Uncharacterized protein n=1 Tax=Tetrapyrgos nigripes TaxID=182062 RepID=A0A8H5FWG1_9AGAR|nr:hypothetical protein D9758_008062 [Tetrapyrgos nigripes]
MGRAFYSSRSSSPVAVSPYPKWSQQNKFDPDSDEFWRDAIYEAFLDTNECLHPDPATNPMADGPDDPAQMLAAALHHPPSPSFSLSDNEGPLTPPVIPTYIYDIPPTAALPSLSSLARQHSDPIIQNAHTDTAHYHNNNEDESDSESDDSDSIPPPLSVIRFRIPPQPSTPPQRSRAIPIPGSAVPNHSLPSFSPPPSVSPRIYNWNRASASAARSIPTPSRISAQPIAAGDR